MWQDVIDTHYPKNPRGLFFQFLAGMYAVTPDLIRSAAGVLLRVRVHREYFEGLSCSISVNKLIK